MSGPPREIRVLASQSILLGTCVGFRSRFVWLPPPPTFLDVGFVHGLRQRPWVVSTPCSPEWIGWTQ